MPELLEGVLLSEGICHAEPRLVILGSLVLDLQQGGPIENLLIGVDFPQTEVLPAEGVDNELITCLLEGTREEAAVFAWGRVAAVRTCIFEGLFDCEHHLLTLELGLHAEDNPL